MTECVHLPDYAGETCAGCGEEIDGYGNTTNDFKFCSYPDCGCDGARLCMAGEASERAGKYNVEGMYHSRDPKARMAFMAAYYGGEFEPRSDAASGIAARSDETAQQAQPEGQEPDLKDIAQ